MADDDRYRWLDDEAAERLLRGSVVNARSARYGGRHGAGRDNVEGAPTSAYDSSSDAGYGGGGRSVPPAPSWARTGPAGSEDSFPGQRGREVAPGLQGPQGPEGPAEERLAHLLDTLVAEQTATLHALGAARTGTVQGDAGAELPGEAAAVAAFRAAHPYAAAEHDGTVDITAGPTESTTVVGRRAARENRRRARERRPGGARRTPLVGRPLRAGFAMAVAGCALGGAAVAAGTGVLPSPFGGGDSPAASVSPLASGSERDEAAGGGGGSPYDGDGPRRGTREGTPSDSPNGEDLAGTERGRGGKNSGGPKDWWHGDGKHLSESEKKAMARALCHAYESGDISVKDRLRLETVAGGSAKVEQFCDEHDGGRENSTESGGAGDSGSVGTPGGPGGSGDSEGSSTGSDSGGQDGGDSEGPGGSRPDSGGQSTDGGSDASGTSSPSPSDEPSVTADTDADADTDTGTDADTDTDTDTGTESPDASADATTGS